MAGEEAEARERGADGGVDDSVVDFVVFVVRSRGSGGSGRDPRPEGGSEAGDVERGIGVEHEDGFASRERVGGGLKKIFVDEKKKRRG